MSSESAPGAVDVTSKVAALGRSVAEASLSQVWAALSIEDRALALEAGAEEDPTVRAWMIAEVSRARHFREKTVRSWSVRELANQAARIGPPKREWIREVFIAFHGRHRSQILVQYLDELRVPHENGLVSVDAEDCTIGEEQAKAAALALLRVHPADQVVVYFVCLNIISPFLCPGIQTWLPELLNTIEPRGG